MDRKYRQRGYMDGDREEKPAKQKRPEGPKEFRPREMPGFHEATRCSMCGASLSAAIELESQCPQCKADLHTCKQCTWFDTGARFECTQPIPERIPRKNIRNQCATFKPKKAIERDTTSANKVTSARDAFDALFKK
ncbi:MAG: hypothetical protein U0V70_00620 [Terriglobia bacterium]